MPLKHQIGGHAGVSSDESGTLVIKPAAPREIAFYQLLHSLPPAPKNLQILAAVNPGTQETTITADDGAPNLQQNEPEHSLIRREILLAGLAKFLPKFYGTLKVESAPIPSGTAKEPPTQASDEAGSPHAGGETKVKSKPVEASSECIIIQNLTTPFLRPCIMDIKLGTTLYDPEDPSLTEAKRLKMEEKMRVRSSTKTGMAITGFQTWNAQEEKYVPRSREDCGKLKPEELAGAFVDYWSLGGTEPESVLDFPLDASDVAGTGAGIKHGQNDAEGGDRGDVLPNEHQEDAIGSVGVNVTSTYSTGLTKSPQPDSHLLNTIRSLRALQKTLERFYTLISHLEIRFIGASLLIIYEGDPSRLQQAWRLTDRGVSRGDGLDEDDAVEEDGFSDIEGEEEESAENGLPQGKKRRKSFFANVFGGFGAERGDGSQGFGLLDGSPPVSPRRLHAQLINNQSATQTDALSHTNTAEEDESIDRSDDEESEDEERIPDSDAKDRLPRPFTIRLIDFAHTRLADGEGPDLGFLQGVRAVIALVEGRIRQLEKDAV
ncbi:hypothetical protein QFC22_004890 [Naganishia vaughanmartiniae]|uniref:Uncharacterized protein n=1 Tax=Naganishia vaughanmartiniae TaxID=1424756 RepID=A0ACC2WY94_9TREE|nr:hypothetical protein QFC22_004890 [Naganishia vaughanmartiniae]